MKSFHKEEIDQCIRIHIGNTSSILAINKMRGMVSLEMDIVAHEIWVWSQSTKNSGTGNHRVFNIEADKESRVQEE